jgi:hypothetical protein
MKLPLGMRRCVWIGLATFPVFLALGFSAQAVPLGEPGTVATYELLADTTERPTFERENRLTVVSAQIQLGPGVDLPGRGRFQWCGLNWTRLNDQHYQLWMLLDQWPTLDADPTVLHYLWREPDWPDTVGFVHEVTGQAMLPRISLWKYGWPQDVVTGGTNWRAPVAGMPEEMLLQGWRFRRVLLAQRQNLAVPTNWTTVKLNPDLLIGWIAGDRDVEGRPHYRLPDGKYQYQPNTEADVLAHVRAGANFCTSKALPEWLTRSSVFRSTQQTKFVDWPADLYRPNYWGHRNHIDEPGVMILGLDSRKPAEVVERLQKTVRNALRPKDEDTRSFMDVRVDSRFGRGNLSIVEEDYPTWEVFFDNAWYQLAVPGLGGVVDQDTKMFGPGTMVEAYNMAFGTHIPPTTENSCAIRVALMRGAARNFNKKWGVGLYDPDGFKLRSGKLAYFYDKGATYFWTWTGWIGIGDNSGLPYPYQRQCFSLIRQAFERNPRRDMQALLRAARVAVVIPYGYTFSPTPLNRIYWLHLERVNEQGVTYRQVLANVTTEVERLLRRGIEFDVAVDEPHFTAQGYDELIYIREDGRVRIVRPGESDQRLDAPRTPERPDLGPMPQLSIQVVGEVPAAGGKLKVRANVTPGTGDWHGEITQPIVNWEVYDDERLMPITDFAIFPVRGRELSFKVERPGRYLVRAAVADVFGRPAIAYQTLHVR